MSFGKDVGRPGVSSAALKEEARRTSHLLDGLAHRTRVVRGDQPVLPRHEDGVASVVDKGRQRSFVSVVKAQDSYRLVDETLRVAADDDPAIRRAQPAI